VHANAFEKLATRNVPMGITWTINIAYADVDRLHVAAKVAVLDTLVATATAKKLPAFYSPR